MIDGTPYSVRLYAADTSVYLTIDPAQRNSGGATRHALTAGTYLVLASWSGVESFTVVPFVAGVAQMTRRKFTLYDVSGGALWVCSITLAGYLFGNIPLVKEHLSHIIWAMILIPGVLVLFGAWKTSRQKKQSLAG